VLFAQLNDRGEDREEVTAINRITPPVQRQTQPARRKKPLGPAFIVSLVIVGILLVVAIAGGT
jgi:hypothetical protein